MFLLVTVSFKNISCGVYGNNDNTTFIIFIIAPFFNFYLTHNQIVGFYQQNVWKTPVEGWDFK